MYSVFGIVDAISEGLPVYISSATYEFDSSKGRVNGSDLNLATQLCLRSVASERMYTVAGRSTPPMNALMTVRLVNR